jgi:hypothetical protein
MDRLSNLASLQQAKSTPLVILTNVGVQKHHEIEWFFSTSLGACGDTTIVVGESL